MGLGLESEVLGLGAWVRVRGARLGCNDSVPSSTNGLEAGPPSLGRPNRTMKMSILILLVGALLATWSEGHARPQPEPSLVRTIATR